VENWSVRALAKVSIIKRGLENLQPVEPNFGSDLHVVFSVQKGEIVDHVEHSLIIDKLASAGRVAELLNAGYVNNPASPPGL
jgi:hypothetical protein